MNMKAVFAVSLFLLLALTFAAAQDAPAADAAAAPAPEVGASEETADVDVEDDGSEGDEDYEEEELAEEGEEGDSESEEYDDEGTSEADVESWFNELDANKDGLVDFEEYKTYFLKSDDPSSPSNITEADLTDSFKILDTQSAGKVNLTQFKNFYIQHEQEPEYVDGHHGPLTAEQKAEYRKHFDEADKDKDGFLNLQEFQSLTAETDADASEDEHIKALFAEVDSNKDGKVDFDEYLGEDDKVVDAQAQAPANQDKPATAA